MEIKEQYKSLVESLKLLSASYENQLSYLPEYVDILEDVTSTFDNAFMLLPQLIEQSLLSNQAIASVLRCHNWMEINLRNEETSSVESFKNGEPWQKVRALAKLALENMNEVLGAPDLNFINASDE